mgnify:CR=1 FL=1
MLYSLKTIPVTVCCLDKRYKFFHSPADIGKQDKSSILLSHNPALNNTSNAFCTFFISFSQ